MQFDSTNLGLPYPDWVAHNQRQAAKIQQIRAKPDIWDVKHAEKFYTARVILSGFWGINRAD